MLLYLETQRKQLLMRQWVSENTLQLALINTAFPLLSLIIIIIITAASSSLGVTHTFLYTQVIYTHSPQKPSCSY